MFGSRIQYSRFSFKQEVYNLLKKIWLLFVKVFFLAIAEHFITKYTLCKKKMILLNWKWVVGNFLSGFCSEWYGSTICNRETQPICFNSWGDNVFKNKILPSTCYTNFFVFSSIKKNKTEGNLIANLEG